MKLADLPPVTIPRFPIEAGHIAIFARAIGDPNPVYSDRDYALSVDTAGIIAPPTFVEAGLHFDPAFPFRPHRGQPWLGSGREPTGRPGEASGGTSFHAETRFEYHGVLRPGDVLSAATRPGRSWARAGRRSGNLEFTEKVTEYRNQHGNTVVRATNVGVTTERKVDLSSAAQREPDPWIAALAEVEPVGFLEDLRYPVPALTAADLDVGQSRGLVVADDLPRAQIVQYAGAVGDVSPQHVDEVYNTVVGGYPSTFAHGMLSMAMTARVLTDWVGDGRLVDYAMRFLSQVWPGDTLTAYATVTQLSGDAEGPLASFRLATVRHDGEPVATASATASLQPAGRRT